MYVPVFTFHSLKYSGSSQGVSRNSSGMGRVWGMFSGIVSSSSESILYSAHHAGPTLVCTQFNMYVCTYTTVICFIYKFHMQESYENFLHENFAKDRNTLIEQSNYKSYKNYFTQKYFT